MTPFSGPFTERSFWDSACRTFWFRGQAIKVFRQPSRMQILVLQAFENQDWPPRIATPLPGTRGLKASMRLHNTLKRLNLHQRPQLIQFSADGTGRGILWQPLHSPISMPSLPDPTAHGERTESAPN